MAQDDIAILIDSTANIPAPYVDEYKFHVMNLRVNWPGESIESQTDAKEIEAEGFFDRLRASKELPTTSQPSPGEFMQMFAEIGKTHKKVLAILVSEKISGTVKSAQFALNMAEDMQIEIVDSKNAGTGMAMIAFKAAEAVQNGSSLAEAAAAAREAAERTRTWFVVDTLEYLHKGGRLSGTRKLIGTLMDMKPLLHMVDGAPELFGTVRSLDNAVDSMLNFVEVEAKNKKRMWVGISHADSHAMAAEMEEEVRKRFSPEILITTEFSPVVGVHLGPGALGIAHLTED